MKILIVEDNIQICELYQLFLKEMNGVITATSIRDARLFLKSNPDIDLVVLDGLVPLFRNEMPTKTLGLASEILETHPNIVNCGSII